MKEYLVEVFDKQKADWLYVYTIAEDERKALQIIRNERYKEASKRNRSYLHKYHTWHLFDFKVRKAFELHKDINCKEKVYCTLFGDKLCLYETDVFIKHL